MGDPEGALPRAVRLERTRQLTLGFLFLLVLLRPYEDTLKTRYRRMRVIEKAELGPLRGLDDNSAIAAIEKLFTFNEMTPNKQLNLHEPAAGVIGDCWRTCIACLLDKSPSDVQCVNWRVGYPNHCAVSGVAVLGTRQCIVHLQVVAYHTFPIGEHMLRRDMLQFSVAFL